MKKVLIIEDDPVVAHIYRTRLEREDYTVETCADGQAGFYRVHEFRPDGVLLDMMLPKMNGIDILKKIRAQAQFQRVPVIVFTNGYVPNMIQEALAAGASQVFNKATLTPRQILDSLHALIASESNPDVAATSRTPGDGAPSADNLTTPLAPPAPAASFTAPTPSAYVESARPFSHEPRPFVPVVARSPVAIPTPAVREPVSSDDSAFLDELRQSFLASAHDTVSSLRKLLQDFTKSPNETARQPLLAELYRKVHALTGSAGIAGFETIAQMASAIEVLLKELQEKPKNVNPSTLRTVAHSFDFIAELFKAPEAALASLPTASILVVDDEILSRRAVTYALDKAGLKSVNVEDSSVALRLAEQHAYDLIFLDVQMPGMDGFELCTRIRAHAQNRSTPIIFVTSLTDFKSRAKSSLSGGTDLIAKPFMFIELTVKALTHVLRGHIGQRRLAA